MKRKVDIRFIFGDAIKYAFKIMRPNCVVFDLHAIFYDLHHRVSSTEENASVMFAKNERKKFSRSMLSVIGYWLLVIIYQLLIYTFPFPSDPCYDASYSICNTCITNRRKN